jgi:hypothetical protein
VRKLILATGVGVLVSGFAMLRLAEADHTVQIKVRALHSKTCVANIESALKGKGKVSVSQSDGLVSVTVPHTGPVNLMELITAIRSKGYEPLSVVMHVAADAKVAIRSSGFGVNDSKKELQEALGELGFLDINSVDYRANVLTLPVTNSSIDVVRLLNAASRAGFALSGIEVTGSPTSVTTVTAGGGLQQPVRDTCIVIGKAAKLFTKYKGVDVPFCCKNCQGKFEALPDTEKDFAVKDAVDRLGVAKGSRKDTPVPTTLPTQAQLGNKCVILGEPGRANLARKFGSLNVPICCKNCQETWDAMSDADKRRTLAAAAKK